MSTDKSQLLSIRQAAERLKVSTDTVRRWADAGEIHVVRLPSGYRRFFPEDVERKARELGLLRPEER